MYQVYAARIATTAESKNCNQRTIPGVSNLYQIMKGKYGGGSGRSSSGRREPVRVIFSESYIQYPLSPYSNTFKNKKTQNIAPINHSQEGSKTCLLPWLLTNKPLHDAQRVFLHCHPGHNPDLNVVPHLLGVHVKAWGLVGDKPAIFHEPLKVKLPHLINLFGLLST